ncbi:MAG: hypothetical protein ACI4Q4_00705 [Oscillospiraceae bacterium]
MTPKEYLQQAYRIDRKIKLDIEKQSAMRSALFGKAVSYESDGAQHTPHGDGIEAAMLRVLEYEERINAEIDRLTATRLKIEQVINLVPDDIQREVLTRRYLLYQKWEYIAVEMNYNIKWIFKLHGKALSKLTIESDY